jgi:hypothetical protein
MNSSELSDIRAALAAALPWTPLDCVPGLQVEGDRAREAERLTRPLPVGDDLRQRVRLPDGTSIFVAAERLPWDSEFFGYGVARLDGIHAVDPARYRPESDYGPALTALLQGARAANVRYLFAMVDARDLATLRALGNAGFALIETRSLYHAAIEPDQGSSRHAVRWARADDVPHLARAARTMVNPYDRFHADPFVGAANADRMMERWAHASVLEGFADATLVPDVPEPTAMCTVRYHRANWDRWGLALAQTTFSVVGPELKGWYRKLMLELHRHFREVGVAHAYYVTQVTNSAVIHVLSGLGYRFGRAEHVLRILL